MNKKINFTIAIFITISLITVFLFLVYSPSEQSVDREPEQGRVEVIKKDLLKIIPEKYELVESASEEPSEENDGCVHIYKIHPKEYSDMEREYLDDAGLIYCEDINTAVLYDQTEQVRYDETEGKWIYGDNVKVLEETQYGENLVPTVALGGTHALSNYYIVKLDNSDELIVLSIPLSNRIRCDVFEDGVEKKDKDCLEYRESIGIPLNGPDWVPEDIYENKYESLLQILTVINK
jgi:hypothetical protein